MFPVRLLFMHVKTPEVGRKGWGVGRGWGRGERGGGREGARRCRHID